MNTLKKWFNTVGDVMSADVRRGLFQPTETRTLHNGFDLISLRPYLDYDAKGRAYANKNKPFRYPMTIRRLEDTNVNDYVWAKSTIGCADDICYEEIKARSNVEVKAHGMDISLSEAMLEAARCEGIGKYKYILFEHPLQSRRGTSGIILENTAAPNNASEVVVVTLVPKTKIESC
jgi:hypothetical protein